MLTVGTYNLANLKIDQKSARQLELLAHNIERSDVQVLALQEVHGREPLERFLGQYLPEKFEIALEPGNDKRGIHVAVISRLPIREVASHRHLPFRRDVLRVDFEHAGQIWSMFAAHLKSRRPSKDQTSGPTPNQERLAEARELSKLASGVANPFLVCGDFNDEPDSPALRTLLSSLASAADVLPEKKRATFPGKNPKRQIDYILCPPELRTRVSAARVWKEARCSDHCLFTASFSCP